MRAARDRTGRSADLLVVGLGNPGAEYARSRHNVGADAVGLLARRLGLSLRGERGTRAHLASSERDEKLLVLAVPDTYMNDSGIAVSSLCRRYSVTDLTRLLVVHDELDLEPGVVRLKLGGGTAGHNGLRSIESHLHALGFVRVRIGIGKPPGRASGANYVLRPATGSVREVLDVAVELAADAVELVLERGLERAMTEVNQR